MKHNAFGLTLVLIAIAISGNCAAQETVSPCPEVLIDQKYDHVPLRVYREQGWDTAITCENRQIELSTEPYIPVQFFNGTYIVEQVPYNPPDTSFSMGTQMPINTDDNFAGTITQIPYPFYFFGIRKTQFCLGANGLVTFSTSVTPGATCPWSFSAPIPWPDGTSGAPSNLSYMRDAIYGVYEDTHPLSSYLSGTQGIYYGIQDQFPCRKIICSWNGVPEYNGSSNLNNRCTYQIVCYEGSNIIEVHVKRRGVNTSWQNGVGIIGIQNATGAAQQKSTDHDAPNYYVVNGSPAAFFPAGKNTFNTVLDSTAYRFTPQGTTNKNYEWYRIFDDGRDSVMLTTNPTDTNGYYIPMDPTSAHPTQTRAIVSPTCVSKYVMHLKFKNANNDWYNLYDTITIGIDTTNDLYLKFGDVGDTSAPSFKNVCDGSSAIANLTIPESQVPRTITWTAVRVINGEEITLPNSMYMIGSDQRSMTILPDAQFDTLPHNKIDTIYMQASVEFVSGCQNFARALVSTYPNFDTTQHAGICKGDVFEWHYDNKHPELYENYSTPTNPETTFKTLMSAPGCDSIVRLYLEVLDVSTTIDKVDDCKPIVWKNGTTYTESNSATASTDTVVLQNQYGCDSVVRLDFTLHPVIAQIESNLTHFDFDHLDVVLTDVSTGNDSRLWTFPSGATQTGLNAYYSISVSQSEADINMIAFSPYGCSDTTNIVIPFNKETFWIPNVFTPDDPAGNSTFSSISSQTLTQTMQIFNRLGQQVFECEGVDCGWDGRDMNGNPCPQGAYVYLIRYTNSFEPNVIKIKKGTVTLLR